MSTSDLFRAEALCRGQPEGTPLGVSPGLKHAALAATGVVAAALVCIGFLTYAERVTVRGYIDSAGASVKVFAPRPGVLDQLLVDEGSEVVKGQPLALLASFEAATADALARSVGAELELLKQRELAEVVRLETLRGGLRLEAENIAVVLQKASDGGALARQRLVLAEERHGQVARLASLGHVAERELLESRDFLAARRQGVASLDLAIAERRLELTRVRQRLARLDADELLTELELRERALPLERRAIDLAAERAYLVTAPKSGRVTHLQAARGQRVTARTPLLSVVGESSARRAVLWAPSSRAGRLSAGQPARIRFDGYPHRRNGAIEGEVVLAAREVLAPDEIDAPMVIREPSFRLVVALFDTGSLRLDGGMPLEADVLVGQRSAWSWILDPLQAIWSNA